MLAPSMVTDPNENRTAVAFDELGMVVKTAVMGKVGAGEGDDLDDPTATFEYDLDCFVEGLLEDEIRPVYVKAMARETHGDPQTRWQTIYSYSDGFGREIQTKVQAEPGLAPHRDENGALVYVDGELDLQYTETLPRSTARAGHISRGTERERRFLRGTIST